MSERNGCAADRAMAIGIARIWAHARTMRMRGSLPTSQWAHVEAIESISKTLLDACDYQVCISEVMEEIR